MFQTGGDTSWLRPVTPEERGEGEGQPLQIGTHRGNYAALNIRNPQPGRHYAYVRADGKSYRRYVNEGWQPLRDDSPEQWGAEALPEWVQQQVGGARAFGDLMPMWIPHERYQEIVRARLDLAAASLRRTDRAYLDKGLQREAELGGRAQGRPVYYFRPGHGQRVMGPGSR